MKNSIRSSVRTERRRSGPVGTNAGARERSFFFGDSFFCFLLFPAVVWNLELSRKSAGVLMNPIRFFRNPSRTSEPLARASKFDAVGERR